LSCSVYKALAVCSNADNAHGPATLEEQDVDAGRFLAHAMMLKVQSTTDQGAGEPVIDHVSLNCRNFPACQLAKSKMHGQQATATNDQLIINLLFAAHSIKCQTYCDALIHMP
jgi:hypothetical protein